MKKKDLMIMWVWEFSTVGYPYDVGLNKRFLGIYYITQEFYNKIYHLTICFFVWKIFGNCFGTSNRGNHTRNNFLDECTT